MKICNICQNNFESLKNNCHVIPRFLMKQSKVNGRNVSVTQTKIHRKNQIDNKVDDAWCADCEALLKIDDDYAKNFFDKRIFFKKEELFSSEKFKNKIGLEIHDSSNSLGFKRFVISIILRHAIYLKKYEMIDLLGPHFEKLRNIYINNLVSDDQYPVAFIKYTQGINMIGYPARERNMGINSISIIIFAYKIWIYVDKRHITDDHFRQLTVNSEHFCGLVMHFKESQLYKDLVEMALKHLGKQQI